MRKLHIIIFINLLTFSLMGQTDSVAYSVGVEVAKRIKKMNLDASSLQSGIDAIMDGKDIAADIDTEKNFSMFLEDFKKIEGQLFLDANGKRDGVTTTASGLQYEIMKPGNGPKPSVTDEVNVHYHGTTIDGNVFDSSVQRGEPISFPLNRVILGWQEGVALMPVGSKYKLFIPYNLAYGEKGAGASIPPYAALIFEVELLGIK